VYVSGRVGDAAAGLAKLRAAGSSSRQSAVGSGTPTETDDCRLFERYLRPEPRIRLGTLLARNRAATACVDLSDGLADAVHQIAHASGVGMAIDADAIPCDGDPLHAATGGDDYELLFTVRPRTRHRLRTVARHTDVPFTRIGICTDVRDVVLRRGDAPEPMPRGYAHFG
jgi:thiamine-monophosphate kinase